jgi:hypothetical protein
MQFVPYSKLRYYGFHLRSSNDLCVGIIDDRKLKYEVEGWCIYVSSYQVSWKSAHRFENFVDTNKYNDTVHVSYLFA